MLYNKSIKLLIKPTKLKNQIVNKPYKSTYIYI